MKCSLRVEDMIEMTFTLDNNQQSEICYKGIVRRVNDRSVGVEFCDMSTYSAELGFYLMPS